MVTTINSYYLISILPTYYLSRDQESYLSREAWKMPSLYPTNTEYCAIEFRTFRVLNQKKIQTQPTFIYLLPNKTSVNSTRTVPKKNE